MHYEISPKTIKWQSWILHNFLNSRKQLTVNYHSVVLRLVDNVSVICRYVDETYPIEDCYFAPKAIFVISVELFYRNNGLLLQPISDTFSTALSDLCSDFRTFIRSWNSKREPTALRAFQDIGRGFGKRSLTWFIDRCGWYYIL